MQQIPEHIKDPEELWLPDADELITEDDTPVDNLASEKQQRLLVSSLYSSFTEQTFLAACNVGVFYTPKQPPLVPDVFLSLGVQAPESWWEKANRSYLIWQFGKPPEVVIEIVSNKVGEELTNKLRLYAMMRVSYYIVYDPSQQLGEAKLSLYELRGFNYFKIESNWLEQVNLGITLWEGEFEQRRDIWLRWCNEQGEILLTGDERAQIAQQQAQAAQQQAQAAQQRAEILAERLRALGIDPDNL